MPDIPVGAQIFDFVFHPHESLVYTGLLTGEIKAFSYDEQGQHEPKFSLKPSKKSCRGLAIDDKGDRLWAVGKSKALYAIDNGTGKVVETRLDAHESPINRVRYVSPHLLATGDDDGVVKLWDPRKPEATRIYTHHVDFISDFLWLSDKKHLVVTSGDGTLSVLDVRASKTTPFAQSEDQEDELLSIVAIKGGSKVVVGTQLGILSIFNRKSGWGDCVDRVPGHPHSIDALCALPSSYPSSHSTVLTGSSDGLVRAVQLLPTKLLGVVADHGEFPVERIVIDRAGEGRWVGSAGHEEALKLTDLKDIFEDEEEGEDGEKEEDASEDEGEKVASDDDNDDEKVRVASPGAVEEKAEENDSDSDKEEPQEKKRKRKQEKDPLSRKKGKKGRNELITDASFFSEL